MFIYLFLFQSISFKYAGSFSMLILFLLQSSSRTDTNYHATVFIYTVALIFPL